MGKIFMNVKLDTAGIQRICLFFVFCVIVMSNFDAFAANTPSQSNDAISLVLCNIIGQLQGGIGKGIATIAIIVLGIGLFLGKLSWPVAVATALGIGLIFGAAGIVTWISSGTSNGGAPSCPPAS